MKQWIQSEKQTATFNKNINAEYDDGMHYCYVKLSVLFYLTLQYLSYPSNIMQRQLGLVKADFEKTVNIVALWIETIS